MLRLLELFSGIGAQRMALDIAKHPAGRWKVDDDFGMPTDAEERP